MNREIDAGADKRFWSKVNKGDEDWHCWEWNGSVLKTGYGNLTMNGRSWRAHRVSFMWFYGFLPEAVCHTCDNRRCVNPLHLFAGTKTSNNGDRDRKGRQAKGDQNKGGVVRKVTVEMAASIRDEWLSQTAIAKKYGISRRLVWEIKKGLRHGPS